VTSSKRLGTEYLACHKVGYRLIEYRVSKSWLLQCTLRKHEKYSHKRRVDAEKNRRGFSQALGLFDVRPGGSCRGKSIITVSNDSSIKCHEPSRM